MYGTLELTADDGANLQPQSKNKFSFAAIIFGLTFMGLVFLTVTTRNYKSKAFFKNSIPSISVWNPDYKNSLSLMLLYPFLENSRLQLISTTNVALLEYYRKCREIAAHSLSSTSSKTIGAG